MHCVAIGAFFSLSSLLACAHPLPPPVAKPTTVTSTTGASGAGSAIPTGELGPLVRLGLLEDHVAFSDREITPDGAKDFGFRIRVSGEVLGFTLTSSDTKGNAVPGLCWDTYVDATPMPKVLGLSAQTGGETAGLAVVDAQGMVLNPKGSFPAHTFHDELVSIWCPDPGPSHFIEGRAFTLLVLRPGNRVDRSTVVLV